MGGTSLHYAANLHKIVGVIKSPLIFSGSDSIFGGRHNRLDKCWPALCEHLEYQLTNIRITNIQKHALWSYLQLRYYCDTKQDIDSELYGIWLILCRYIIYKYFIQKRLMLYLVHDMICMSYKGDDTEIDQRFHWGKSQRDKNKGHFSTACPHKMEGEGQTWQLP